MRLLDPDRTFTVRQISRFVGAVLAVGVLTFGYLVVSHGWNNQPSHNRSPFRMEALPQVCKEDDGLGKPPFQPFQGGFGSALKPATDYEYAERLAGKPECFGHRVRKSLYGSSHADFRMVFVNAKAKPVLEVTVINLADIEESK